jgi:cytochrome c-type biogenesis protein CcmH/NrfG
VSWEVALAAVIVIAVVGAGVVRPFGRPGGEGTGALTDPLDDERTGLLRTLRDLENEHDSGQLADADYRALRVETERRAVAVLRAIDAREGGDELGAGLAEIRETTRDAGEGTGDRTAARGPRRIVALAVTGALVAAVGVALAASSGSRDAGQSITGNDQAVAGIAFFEQRVRDHPKDLAARLDLAQRYLEVGNAPGAVEQYLAALSIDPSNAEARATLGFVLYLSGKPQEGLESVRQALASDPNDPEALYYEGVILLEGLQRPAEAAAAFRAYLAKAPFGSHRDEVRSLLDRAEAASG